LFHGTCSAQWYGGYPTRENIKSPAGVTIKIVSSATQATLLIHVPPGSPTQCGLAQGFFMGWPAMNLIAKFIFGLIYYISKIRLETYIYESKECLLNNFYKEPSI
jgi:hypothetical protein